MRMGCVWQARGAFVHGGLSLAACQALPRLPMDGPYSRYVVSRELFLGRVRAMLAVCPRGRYLPYADAGISFVV